MISICPTDEAISFGIKDNHIKLSNIDVRKIKKSCLIQGHHGLDYQFVGSAYSEKYFDIFRTLRAGIRHRS